MASYILGFMNLDAEDYSDQDAIYVDNFLYLMKNIKEMVDWTVPAKGKKGDHVFFFCGSDTNNHLGSVIKTLEQWGGPKKCRSGQTSHSTIV